MNIVVIGLGSMGKRRVRLIKQYSRKAYIAGVDSNLKRANDAAELFQMETYGSISEACKNHVFDVAFVCTAPLSHAKIIKELIEKGLDIFTELNLVSDGYGEFISQQAVKLFLSSTFLYRKDIEWIANRVKGEKVNYIYHTGQYLPDWHPWEDYKEFFAGDRRTNGCREIFAIELPWLSACFGALGKITVLKDKMTELCIDYPDNYMLLIQHSNGNKGLMAVDVVARKAARRIEIYNEKLQIYWNGSPETLQEWDCETGRMENVRTYKTVEKDKNYCENIIENAYLDEIDAFFSWIGGDKSKVKYGFRQDKEILAVIDQIEGQALYECMPETAE